MSSVFIFDMDGVIADSWDTFFHSCCILLNAKGHSHLCNEQSILQMFNDNFMVGLKKALAPETITSDDALILAKELNERIFNTPCHEAVIPVIQQLQLEHLLYLVTSNFRETAQIFIKKHQLTGFKSILGLDDHQSKVAKIQQVSKNHPGKPVYYIGDTLGDIKEAQTAQAISIAVSWGWHDSDTLRTGQPDYLIDTPEQLLQIANTAAS